MIKIKFRKSEELTIKERFKASGSCYCHCGICGICGGLIQEDWDNVKCKTDNYHSDCKCICKSV